MDSVDNNQFEVVPTSKSKRKIIAPRPNVYMNPALDILANEDPMCNTAMEIVPNKKRKRSRSCDIVAFENSALDLGISKAAVNAFLAKELENVRKNLKNGQTIVNNTVQISKNHTYDAPNETFTSFTNIEDNRVNVSEPIYANVDDLSALNFNNATNNAELVSNHDNTVPNATKFVNNEINQNDSCTDVEMDSGISILEQKSLNTMHSALEHNDLSAISKTTNIQSNVTNQVFINNSNNISLSFIDKLAIESPNVSNQTLYLDDDLNESNIMEIKTITIITKKKRVVDKRKNTNPFLNTNLDDEIDNLPPEVKNPFSVTDIKELEYNEEGLNRPEHTVLPEPTNIMPRRLFSNDNNSTVSTMNETENSEMQHEYENIDEYRSESPIYENVGQNFCDLNINKQSKILGHDVTRFSAADIMNLNKNSTQANVSNENSDSKKDFKHQILKASNKLSKKVFKTFKKKFKGEKPDANMTLNPYEVPRKLSKQKTVVKEAGFENPALNLDNSDEIDIEELEEDGEHQYETIKTLRNTRLNMNVTPLKERSNEVDFTHNKSNTPSKKVRFDSTLNQEKIITGNSFDLGLQSPGFDAKLDKYHDELENCINERKFLQQNM